MIHYMNRDKKGRYVDYPYGDPREKSKKPYKSYGGEKVSKKDNGGWSKSYGVTSNLDLNAPIKTASSVALVIGALVGGWLLFPYLKSFLEGKTGLGQECPAGTHLRDTCAGQVGLPGVLCGAGGWITGGIMDCVPDSQDNGGTPCTGSGCGGSNPPPVIPDYGAHCYDQMGAWMCQLEGGFFDATACECIPVLTDGCYPGSNKCEGNRVYDCTTKLDWVSGAEVNTWVVTPYGC